MKKLKSRNNILRFFRLIYLKIFGINDSPRKIAQGMALGVFAGIIPGMGPIAALFLAFIFHTNRASALLGSIVSNTLISLATFFLSIKLGSVIIGLDWSAAYREWLNLIRNFSLAQLLSTSILKIILALLIGYAVIAIVLGLLTYLLTLVLTRIMHAHKSRINLPG